MIIIGLTGRARSGKDTVGKYLEEHYDACLTSFAAPIRQMVMTICGYKTLEELEENKETIHPNYNCTPRKMMQTLGTEWGRQTVDTNIWIKTLDLNLLPNDLNVITDVRFDNEAEFILERGGEIWNIVRNVKEVENHSSETGINSSLITNILHNNGSFAELFEQAELHYQTGHQQYYLAPVQPLL